MKCECHHPDWLSVFHAKAIVCNIEAMRRFFSYLGLVLRMSLSRLNKSNPLILASSTAFFTTFSISPIVILLVNVLGIYFEGKEISQRLFVILNETFGSRAEKQIEAIV